MKTFKIDLFDLVTSIARVVDVMSANLADHHLKVSYLAFRIGQELGVPEEKQYLLAMTGSLHDIGAFSLKERIDLLTFEDTKPGEHSLAGHLLLKNFKPFAASAEIIKHHHLPWNDGKGAAHNHEPVPIESHIIHLADRIAVKIGHRNTILGQVPDICQSIQRTGKELFVPEQVKAVLRLSKKDYIWLEAASDGMAPLLKHILSTTAKTLDIEDLLDFSRLICRLIDFKSEFTATHSSGVAAAAKAIAAQVGFSGEEQKLIEIAAYLHDLGKLAVPSEIIEKKGQLSEEEWSVMRSHVFYTYQILEPMGMLDPLGAWSGLHQERLNGKGYPFGYKRDQIPLGSRIVAVADVFTALTEDRPYRKGMPKDAVATALQQAADQDELDEKLIRIVLDNYDNLNTFRQIAQKQSIAEYRQFQMILQQESP